jgi:hypothetical protein
MSGRTAFALVLIVIGVAAVLWGINGMYEMNKYFPGRPPGGDDLIRMGVGVALAIIGGALAATNGSAANR